MKANVQYLNVIVKENLTFVFSSFMIFSFLTIFAMIDFPLTNEILKKEFMVHGM